MDRESITEVARLTGVSELESALADDDYFCTRRKNERVFCADQDVKLSIRLRGELRSHRAELLDISPFGAAVGLTRPLTAERTAFLSFSWGDHRIKDVVCTVSNCLQTSKTNALLTGYRCGLSFRPSSPLQLDRQDTVARINALAVALSAAGASGTGTGTGSDCSHPLESRQQDAAARRQPGLSPSDSGLLPQDQPAA